MDLDRLVEKTGIKKAFLANLAGYKHRTNFSRAESDGFGVSQREKILAALKRIRAELDREIAREEKRLDRAA